MYNNNSNNNDKYRPKRAFGNCEAGAKQELGNLCNKPLGIFRAIVPQHVLGNGRVTDDHEIPWPSGEARAPPRRSDTSSSFAAATGMVESSLGPNVVRDFVREVSQSGLTHEAGLVVGGLLLLAEHLTECDGIGDGTWRPRRRRGRWWVMEDREERESEDDMVAERS
ncbi:hypothetical protein STAS_22372 [Striga asiatica]|uniref:Uncharacterized protein n=1 Tax=Striga asiatica TaxID=4170 RepID=A0A5A7QJD7_STRAF|nr:hypothetical protein STAS_22372 [Striga asiatica]